MTSSTYGHNSSQRQLPVRYSSVSSPTISISFFSSSAVTMPRSVSPRISSRISTSHSSVCRTFLAKFRPFFIFKFSSSLSLSVRLSYSSGNFSKRNSLISGSRRLKNSSTFSVFFSFRNWITTTLFPSLAALTPFPSAAEVLPIPAPQKMCIYRLPMIHLIILLYFRAFWLGYRYFTTSSGRMQPPLTRSAPACSPTPRTQFFFLSSPHPAF